MMKEYKKCLTAKAGKPCVFMIEGKGCTFNGKSCIPIVDNCVGCKNIEVIGNTSYCTAYADPPAKWMSGNCNFATHIVKKIADEKRTLDPRKAAKQRNKAKG